MAREVLLRDGSAVGLPQKAIEILKVLIGRPGIVVTKNELMSLVWPDAFVEEANLTQNIYVLRRTLGEAADENRFIATVPGRGYRFVAEIRRIKSCAVGDEMADRTPGPPGDASQLLRLFHRLKGELAARSTWLISVLVIVATLVVGATGAIPVLTRSLCDHAVALQKNGQVSKAIIYYRRSLALKPNDAAARYNLGSAYEQLANYRLAAGAYQAAIDSDPQFYPAYENLSRLYLLRQRDYPAALKLLDRALLQDPQESWVRYVLRKNHGWANLELSRFDQAEKDLRSAIALKPDQAAAHCLLARVLDETKMHQKAVLEWESCSTFPNRQDAEPEWQNQALERLR